MQRMKTPTRKRMVISVKEAARTWTDAERVATVLSDAGGGRRRRPVTLYLHRERFDAFREHVAPATPSQMIDAFIEDVLERSFGGRSLE